MDEDELLGFLDEGSKASGTQAQVTEPAKTEAAPVVGTEEPAKTSATAQPDKTGTEAPAVVETAKEEPKTVPLATFLDILNENKQLKKGAKKLAEEDEEVMPEAPDPVEDPEGYRQYERSVFELTILNERLNNSERFATLAHGKELMGKVKEWIGEKFGKDDVFAQQILRDPDPYEAAIQSYKQDQLVKEVNSDELTAFRAWKATNGKKPEVPAANGAGSTPATTQPAAAGKPAAAQTKPAATEVPKSIADEPSAGGSHTIPEGPGQAFDSIFR